MPEGPIVEHPPKGQNPTPDTTPTPNLPRDNANHGDSGVDPNAPVTPEGGVLDDGSGRLLISSQLTPAGAVPSTDSIVALGKSQAMFQLGGGEVTHRDVIVGFDGAGALVQTGGRLTLDSLYLAATGESGALVSLEGGQLLVTRSTPDMPHVIEIGGAGKAELRLAGGTIGEVGSGTGASVVVGSMRAAEGTLRGWGDVRLTGVLSNNGKVIRRKTCNSVAPGAVATDINKEDFADPERVARIRQRVPLGRVGTPDDIAGPVVFFASDAARYVNGASVLVDGGMFVNLQ